MSWYAGLEAIVKTSEPLAPRTWFRLGGPAEFFAEPQQPEQLAELVRRCRQHEIPVRMLGGGSNLLVNDAGVPGLVIHLADPVFAKIEVAGNVVTAGGGAKLGHVISHAVRDGLAGLEALVGIPGTVAGAIHGNAGSRGGDIGQWTSSVTVMTQNGETIVRNRNELIFAYRESNLDDLVILKAAFTLDRENPDELARRMQKLWIMKKAEQPMGHQSAGCIFKNPRGMNAGMLIEQAGLKGTRIGGAEVSDRHANFIIAEPGASSSDVMRLIELVRSRVMDRLSVELELEIEIW